jgi:KDO2-lipid IV(A) lauroyltransferase
MLVALFRFLSFFPLPVLHAIGAVLGRLVYMASPSYRKRLKDNLTRAGFGSELGAAIKEAGKNVMELPFVWCASPQRVLATATVENWELVQAALDGKQGVILLTPHLGCFEIIAQAIAARTRLTALYRPPRKEALRPLIEGARARDNLLLAPANLSGVRTMAKALKKSEAIGLLPDQVPQQGEGVWADFFGKPAYTMTLSAKLHTMTNAPVILTYAERLPYGRGYTIRFVAFEGDLGGTAEQQASAINAAMEKLIAHCPAQYFWSYNRYKAPAGVSAPRQDAGAQASTQADA